jgi:tetratricopeptide (TPR) repeat protein
MRQILAVLAALLAAPVFAECPPAPDIAEAQAALLAKAREAENEGQGRDILNELWKLWAMAPDEPAQELLDRGMSARSSYDFLGAIDALDRLVEYCPDYAEGYNQRAFVNFLRQDYEAALIDLDLALERAPEHVAALSGKALTLMGLGRHDEAQEVLREAVKLNPWIPERGMLREPPGKDL